MGNTPYLFQMDPTGEFALMEETLMEQIAI